MPAKFYIYHLPGKKVGCTSNPAQRFATYRAQGWTGKIIILEELNCGPTEAGDREWQWADHFGYKRGWHYSTTWGAKAFKAKIASKTFKANPNKVRLKRKTKR
jgi:hypothetical protein